MDKYEKILENLIEQVKDINTVEYNEIPNIELYMDQVTTFIDDNLECFKRRSSDKILTKTMINNYTKSKLLHQPNKKKYNKNHIMLLIIIYHLKSILSINDIQKLLSPIKEEIVANENTDVLQKVYKGFVLMQKANVLGINNEEEVSCCLKDTEEVQLLQLKTIFAVLKLSIQADSNKRLAEKILDTIF